MKKTLLILIFVLNLVIIFALWWSGSGYLLTKTTADIYIAIGRLAGLLVQLFLLTELVLIGRIAFIEKIWGFDSLNRLHRYIGYSIFATIIAHPLFLSLGYSQRLQINITTQFINFLTQWEDVLPAFFGVLLLAIVVVFSLAFVRKNIKYESWHLFHLLAYIAIALALAHQFMGGDLIGAWAALGYWYVLTIAVFGFLILYRFLKPFFLVYKHQFRIAKIIKESDLIYSIYISGKNIEKFFYQAGQYANIFFLARGFLQPHPFSFSSAPNTRFVRITIKTLGDFTNKIKNLKEGTWVIIDGPLGKFTTASARKQKHLLIAGGIGITPIRALLEEFKKENKDVVLLYGNRTMDDIIFEKELEALGVPRTHILSTQKQDPHEYGYIDKEKIERLIPDFKERDVFVCGPQPMMDLVEKILLQLGVPQNQIHIEKFGM